MLSLMGGTQKRKQCSGLVSGQRKSNDTLVQKQLGNKWWCPLQRIKRLYPMPHMVNFKNRHIEHTH